MMNQINAKPQSRKENIRENAISQVIVDAASEVYRTLGGPGLLENVYKQALVIELKQRGSLVDQEKFVSVRYKRVSLETPFKN